MKFISIKLAFSTLFAFVTCALWAQKQMAITIDDPQTSGSPVMRWQERDEAILKTLDRHRVKAALFVCGKRVDNADGQTLLKKWDEKNHLVCNHSYSHLYYNSKSQTAAAFIADFQKGDSLIRNYKNYTRLFRFPYLKEGNTASKRDSMRTAMAEAGYKNGSVTIDASDWYIDAEIVKALKTDTNANLAAYREYYIRHILDRATYYDSLAQLVLKKPVKHTLLIHHSLLNALFLDELLTALKADGWKLIDAKEAFSDEIFSLQPLIEPCGESIVWQCASLDQELSKTLRYPAEDGTYEKIPLAKYLEAYELGNGQK